MARKSKGDVLAEKAGWFLGITGGIMFLFGMMLFFMPMMTIETVTFLLGVVLLIGGLFKFVDAIIYMKGAKMSAYIAASGVISMLIGLVLIAAPATVTAGVMFAFGGIALLIALIALVSGVGQIVYAAKHGGKKRMFQYAIGIILVILALLMMFNPFGAAVALIMLVALFTIVYGVVLISLALNIREIMEM